MSFHLGQRDDQIGLGDRLREVKVIEAAAAAPIWRSGDFLIIQISKRQLGGIECLANARFGKCQIGVTEMARPFTHRYRRAPAAKHLGGSQHHRRMRRHVRRVARRLYHIWLEQYALAADRVGR